MLDQADIDAIAAAIADRQAPPPPLLDADQAGAMLNVPASWCLAEARAGRLRHVKLGRYTRYRRSDLEDYLDRRAK